jgi:hypothetical protein
MIEDLTAPNDPDVVTDGRYAKRMRNVRNQLLAVSDWTQVADAPVDRQAWADYRQALRDFPATWTPGPTANFPDPPQ